MERRNCIKALLAGVGALATLPRTAASEGESQRSIELHADLAVDPAKEQEILKIFETEFRPAASRQPGFVGVKLLKLSATLRGPAPPGCNYQFVLSFTSEDLRQKWIATPTHQEIWPKIVATLTSPNYSRLLYEVY